MYCVCRQADAGIIRPSVPVRAGPCLFLIAASYLWGGLCQKQQWIRATVITVPNSVNHQSSIRPSDQPSLSVSTHPPHPSTPTRTPQSAGGSSGSSGSLLRPAAASTSAPSGARGKHFAPVEVKDGVAIIRIDGPGKMNTIDDEFRAEIDQLWEVRLRVVCMYICVYMCVDRAGHR